MRLTAEEKAEVIRLVINSPESINKSLRSLGIHKRTFYNCIMPIVKMVLMDYDLRTVLSGNGIGYLMSSVNSLWILLWIIQSYRLVNWQ